MAWLALTVQLVSDRVLFSQSIPPPRAVPDGVDLVAVDDGIGDRARCRPVVLMPPPADVAWLLMIVLEATFSVPWLAMPPPATAELSVDGVPVSVVCRGESLYRPPPLPVGGVAADGAVGQCRLAVKCIGRAAIAIVGVALCEQAAAARWRSCR